MFKNTYNIPFEKFIIKDEYFQHFSAIHGKNHVYRVMFHVLNLGHNLNDDYVTKLAFCAAFIHDFERLHDDYCLEHGQWASEYSFPKFKNLFLSIGVNVEDLDVIVYATKMHSLPDQEYLSGIYKKVTMLLKDADGLDRVRLGDLDVSYLRLPFSANYVHFAQDFFRAIERVDIENFNEVIEIAVSL
ncbi:MAG: hypothetical protein JXR68_00975 [Bacteroidales bacterium]|nr:hypothetical protein [Bacteroidales bacterium]